MARRSGPRRLAAVGLAAFVLAVAACGGTSPLARSATRPSTTAPSTTSPSATAPPTTGPSTTAPSTSSPPTSAAPPTTAPATPQESAKARALIETATRDGRARRWAHVSGTDLATVAGPDRGTQTVTSGSLTGKIRVLPNATYIHGDAAALEDLFKVPPAAATKVAGKWVILTRSDPEYHNVTVGVTLPSELQAIDLKGSLRMESYSRDGKRGTLITGSLPAGNGVPDGLGALLVTAGPHPLPEEFAEFTQSRQTVLVEVFSLWGASESVKAPAGAVPLPKTGSGSAVS